MVHERWAEENKPELYWPMLQTGRRWPALGIAARQDGQYGARSQPFLPAAAPRQVQREIVPMRPRWVCADPATKALVTREVTISADEASAPTRLTKGRENPAALPRE